MLSPVFAAELHPSGISHPNSDLYRSGDRFIHVKYHFTNVKWGYILVLRNHTLVRPNPTRILLRRTCVAGNHKGSGIHRGSRVVKSSGSTETRVGGQWVYIINRGGISSWILAYD